MAKTLVERYTMWKNRISTSKKATIEDHEQDWKKYEDAYEGKILNGSNSDFRDVFASVNLAYVDMRSSIPKLISASPYIYISPETPESDLFAEVIEKVINAKLNDWMLVQKVQSLVQGTKLKGRAYLKSSFCFEEDQKERLIGALYPNDDVKIEFIPRERLVIDKNAKSFEEANWVAHKIEAPIKEIRKKFKLKDDEKPTTLEDKSASNLPEEEKGDYKYGCYYEIEDRKKHEVFTIVDGIDRFVVKPKPMPYPFYSMYDELEWNEIPGKLNTLSDYHFWWKQLWELAATKTMQLNHMRRLNSKYIHRGPEELTDEQAEMLTSYDDGTVAHLPIGHELIPLSHAQLGQEVYLGEQSLRQDISIISGMNEMKQGLPQTKKTAREAMAIMAESQDVISFKQNKVIDVVRRVMRKCIWLIQNKYTTTRVIRLSGMEEAEVLRFKERVEGKIEGLKITKDGRGEAYMSFVGASLQPKNAGPDAFDVKIKPGSITEVNEVTRKQDVIQLLQLTAQVPELKAYTNFEELAKEVGELLNLTNRNIVSPPKSPTQENVLLKRNVPVMPMLNEDHAAHLEQHLNESTGTEAFKQHIEGHRLMMKFIGRPQVLGGQTPGVPGQLGGLNPNSISGSPTGSNPVGVQMQEQGNGALVPDQSQIV